MANTLLTFSVDPDWMHSSAAMRAVGGQAIASFNKGARRPSRLDIDQPHGHGGTAMIASQFDDHRSARLIASGAGAAGGP